MSGLTNNLNAGLSSFAKYLAQARDGVTDLGSAVLKVTSDPAAQAQVLTMVVLPALLFFLLVPGVLLNLPPNTKARCVKLVPKPATATGECNFVTGTYILGTSDTVSAAQMLPICTAQKKCISVWMSRYSSWSSNLLHAFVFVVALVVVRRLTDRY